MYCGEVGRNVMLCSYATNGICIAGGSEHASNKPGSTAED